MDRAYKVTRSGAVLTLAESIQVTFGEYIRRLRRQNHWSLEQLADASGISLTHISRIENGHHLPNPETVVKFQVALEGDLERMLELAKCLPDEIMDRLRAFRSPEER